MELDTCSAPGWRLLCHRRLLWFRWREKPEHGSNRRECGYISDKVTSLVFVINGLCRHDPGMDDARPDGERDQAPML